MIASRFVGLKDVPTSHVILSYPLAHRPLLSLFSSSTYQNALLALVRNPESNVLVVHGDEDDFTGIAKYNSWTAELTTEAKGKLKVEVIPGARHFWGGEAMVRLADVLKSWLRETGR